jgi:hypothetical protein
MQPLHDKTPSLALLAPLPVNIRIRLVAGTSRLAIATIVRRKDAARALN